MSSHESKPIGIDLGTTYSAVAHVNEYGMPEIIHNFSGSNITPSVIFFDKQGQDPIVGLEATNNALAYPEQVVQFVKRQIGEENYRFRFAGEEYDAIQLSSFILKEIKNVAEKRLNREIKEAVITVPAYFGQNEREATIEAGKLAGLDVLKIINEPTAAAVAYGLNQKGKKKQCLVFDLGGGTFDVTIIEIDGNRIRVIATDGNHKLGGKDWDDRLMQYVAAKFNQKYGINPLTSIKAEYDLRAHCEQAKLRLTIHPETPITFNFEGKILKLKIARTLFEELTQDLLGQCEELTLSAMKAAGYQISDIDTVLLVGGSTRMPMIHRSIKELFQKDPSREVNPDECVALGAALTAELEHAARQKRKSKVDIQTEDVAGHSLGLIVYRDGVLSNSTFIKKNTPIPVAVSKENFYTTLDGQTLIDLWLIQGDNADANKWTNLGHFEFFGIIPRPAGETQISITYRYNKNGIVEVEAVDQGERKFKHRRSSLRYPLTKLMKSSPPANIPIIVDCSGSLYGNPMKEIKQSLSSFITTHAQDDRNFAIFMSPAFDDDPRMEYSLEPTNSVKDLEQAIQDIIPIGIAQIDHVLSFAQNMVKNQGRLFVLCTDGDFEDVEAVRQKCEKIRKSGGRIIIITHEESAHLENLQHICVSESDIYFTTDDIDIKHKLTNMIEERIEEG